jgi:hypothetical protein
MESALKIIDAIYRGVSPQELAREFPWEEIVGDSSLELLKYAQHSPDNQHSFQILAYLFRVANGNDLWFATEVLSQTVRHPILSTNERRMILANLRSLLDRIKNQNAVEQPTQVKFRKYRLMEGGYYTVSGATLAEDGKIEEANQNYALAQEIFEQLGLILPDQKESAQEETQPIWRPAVPAGSTPAMRPDTLMFDENQAGRVATDQPAAVDLETFHSLPDVWFEDGQLHLPAVENAGGDEMRQQALQIEQQSEILAGIQLQIQMYLSRRSVLAKEVRNLERKMATLKAAIDRMEKKVDRQED